VAVNGAAAALLNSGTLRPRVIASLRAASCGFRQLCKDYEVCTAAAACKAHVIARPLSNGSRCKNSLMLVTTTVAIGCCRVSCG
jgi:hypothetical protein